MKEFFYPLFNELKQISDEGGISIETPEKKFNFLPLITQCNADLPAKYDMQGTIGHSGYFGCTYCLHPGDLIKANKRAKAVVRYVRKDNVLDRKHIDILTIYRSLKSSPIRGVKSVSCFIAAKEFDLINSFSIDYMHCILLGIMRKLLDLWLNTKNHDEPFYITKKRQHELHKIILSIKPISEITRKPR